MWHVTWASPQPSSFSPTITLNPGGGAAAASSPSSPQQLLIQHLSALIEGETQALDSGRVSNGLGEGGGELEAMMLGDQGGGGNSGMLDALRCAALRVSSRRGALVHALAASVSDCRAVRSVTQGSAYAQQLRALLTSLSSSAVSLPSATPGGCIQHTCELTSLSSSAVLLPSAMPGECTQLTYVLPSSAVSLLFATPGGCIQHTYVHSPQCLHLLCRCHLLCTSYSLDDCIQHANMRGCTPL